MAKNRMFLVCEKCGEKDCIAELHSTRGWYYIRHTEHDRFFDHHRHGDMSDDGMESRFRLEYEGEKKDDGSFGVKAAVFLAIGLLIGYCLYNVAKVLFT